MAETDLSIFKRSNGIWYVAYTLDGTRCWKSTGCKNKPSALLKMRGLDLKPKPRVNVPRNLNSYLETFLHFIGNTHRKKTTEIYTTVCRRFSTLAGTLKLENITAKTWDDYVVLRTPQIHQLHLISNREH